MTDQNTLADKVREVIAAHYAENEGDALKSDLLALLPEPPRPTLADMTVEERRECQWMQADTEFFGRVVITEPSAGVEYAVMLDREGNRFYGDSANVTPRPDLPRMEWPGEQKPDPTLPGGWRLADHQKYGRGIVTTTTPDAYGDIYFAFPSLEETTGYELLLCDAAELTFLDPTQEKNND